VKEREQWIEQCSSRNKELHTVYLDILSKYKTKSVWQELAELEPITGIGKVETDNLVEDYQYKLNQLKITPFQAQAEPTDVVQDAAPVADSQEPLK